MTKTVQSTKNGSRIDATKNFIIPGGNKIQHNTKRRSILKDFQPMFMLPYVSIVKTPSAPGFSMTPTWASASSKLNA